MQTLSPDPRTFRVAEILQSGPSQVTVRVLGPVEILALPGLEPVPLTAHPKALALLVFMLAAEGGQVSRERVLSVLWPESDERHARGALRQTLWVLRTELGVDALAARGKDYLQVKKRIATWDAGEFLSLHRQGRFGSAMELYRGDLLDGFPLRGGHAWDTWLEDRRACYKQLAAEAAWALAEQAEREGDRAAAAYWAKKALDLTPWNELAVRRLIELLDRVGDRSGALRAYRGLEEWLHTEFGALPLPETQRCMERIFEDPEGDVAESRRASSERRSGIERRARAKAPIGQRRSE